MSNIRLAKLLEMLAVQPSDTFLLYAIGMEYLGMNNEVEAENYWRKVLAADENHIAVHYQLAQLFIKQNKEAEAISLLERGLSLAKQKGDTKTMNEFRGLLDELGF